VTTTVERVRGGAPEPLSPPNLGFSRRHPFVWRFWRRKLGVAALAVLLLIVAMATLAPVLAPRDPLAQDLTKRFDGIGKDGYVLGADSLGRDNLSRLIWGGRISLTVGLVASALSLSVGVPLGMLAGYRGGALDTGIMRLVDMLLAFPYILLAIVIVGALGPGLTNTILAIAVTSIPFYIRVIRGVVLSVRHQPFIEAAVTVGATESRIMRTAILPSIMPYIVISLTLSIGWLILEAAGLSFLGLGAQPPSPEWGAMLSEQRQYLAIAPHVVVLPGLVLLVVAACLNLFGDALRDALDVTLDE
jgi:peptide/nickel transport system permease protein